MASQSKHLVQLETLAQNISWGWEWQHTPLISVLLRRQRQVDLSEFEANLVYTVSSRPARVSRIHPYTGLKLLIHLPLLVNVRITPHTTTLNYVVPGIKRRALYMPSEL